MERLLRDDFPISIEMEPLDLTSDLDPILIPIPGDNPAGISLRYEGLYDKIREARRSDDHTLPQGIWQKNLKKADFKEVEALCLEALCQRSKDFQLMAWLIESWFERYWLKGLQRGVNMMIGLVENFWESGYPKIEHEDVEFRLAPFYWMNEKLIERIPELPVTQSSAENQKIFSFYDWKESITLDRLAQKSSDTSFLEKAKKQGRPTTSEIQKAIKNSSLTFYQDLAQDLESSLARIRLLEEQLKEKAGDSDVSLYQLRRILGEVSDMIKVILHEKQGVTDVAPSSLASPENTETTKEETQEVEDYNLNQKISEFFSADGDLSFKNDPQIDAESAAEIIDVRAYFSERSKMIDEGEIENMISEEIQNTARESSEVVSEKVVQPVQLVPVSQAPIPERHAQRNSHNLIQSREEAYALLKVVMQYLSECEPHSPTPYLIKRAISWSNLSLEELFQEIIAENGDLNSLVNLLGIAKRKS
jgi:type VI secretion system protein ImpA